MDDPARISPTAHYTASVWDHADLAHPALRATANPLLFQLSRPANRLARWLTGGLDMPAALIQRHRILDALVEAWVEHRGATRLVELASGLSSRGARMAERYPQITVIEGDLPKMAALKRDRLARGGFSAPNHQVVPVDLLAGTPELPGDDVTVVVTEGLSYYFSPTTWAQIGRSLRPLTQGGAWLFDVSLAGPPALDVRPMLPFLSIAARGRTYAHYAGAQAVAPALALCGYPTTHVHRPSEWADRLPELPQARSEAIFVVETY